MELEYAPEGSTNLVTLRSGSVYHVELQLAIVASMGRCRRRRWGASNTYALTGLEVNLYAKENNHVSHLDASFWCKKISDEREAQSEAGRDSGVEGFRGRRRCEKGEPSASNCRRVSGPPANKERK